MAVGSFYHKIFPIWLQDMRLAGWDGPVYVGCDRCRALLSTITEREAQRLVLVPVGAGTGLSPSRNSAAAVAAAARNQSRGVTVPRQLSGAFVGTGRSAKASKWALTIEVAAALVRVPRTNGGSGDVSVLVFVDVDNFATEALPAWLGHGLRLFGFPPSPSPPPPPPSFDNPGEGSGDGGGDDGGGVHLVVPRGRWLLGEAFNTGLFLAATHSAALGCLRAAMEATHEGITHKGAYEGGRAHGKEAQALGGSLPIKPRLNDQEALYRLLHRKTATAPRRIDRAEEGHSPAHAGGQEAGMAAAFSPSPPSEPPPSSPPPGSVCRVGFLPAAIQHYASNVRRLPTTLDELLMAPGIRHFTRIERRLAACDYGGGGEESSNGGKIRAGTVTGGGGENDDRRGDTEVKAAAAIPKLRGGGIARLSPRPHPALPSLRRAKGWWVALPMWRWARIAPDESSCLPAYRELRTRLEKGKT